MADIKKVIKGIRKCLSHKPCYENGCPYNDECAVDHLNDPLLRDALELLKEQANAYGYLQKQFFEVQDQLLAKPEIIRCKDCMYRSYYCTEDVNGETLYNCKHPGTSNILRTGDFFCAEGEKDDSKKE